MLDDIHGCLKLHLDFLVEPKAKRMWKQSMNKLSVENDYIHKVSISSTLNARIFGTNFLTKPKRN
jgi:hypothetical protein